MHHASSESRTARLALSGFAHLVFVRAENLSQTLDLLVHAVQHLPHRVDFDLASFETLQGKADGQEFRQLHEQGFVGPYIRRLRRQARKRLLQQVLSRARQLRHFFLEPARSGAAALSCPDAAKSRQRTQNSKNLILGGLREPCATAAGTTNASDSGAGYRPAETARRAGSAPGPTRSCTLARSGTRPAALR